jgi:hypothetical protein
MKKFICTLLMIYFGNSFVNLAQAMLGPEYWAWYYECVSSSVANGMINSYAQMHHITCEQSFQKRRDICAFANPFSSMEQGNSAPIYDGIASGCTSPVAAGENDKK